MEIMFKMLGQVITTLNQMVKWLKVNGFTIKLWFILLPNSRRKLRSQHLVRQLLLKSNGKMAKGEWIYDKNYDSYYYLTSEGSYARNTWSGNYYLKSNGKMAKSEWVTIRTMVHITI